VIKFNMQVGLKREFVHIYTQVYLYPKKLMAFANGIVNRSCKGFNFNIIR